MNRSEQSYSTKLASFTDAQLKAEILGLRVELAFRKFVLLHRKYASSQPRIPAGQPGGGRWTDGVGWSDGLVRVAQNGPVRLPVRRSRLSGREVEGTPAQISEWAATRLQADAAVRAVRQIDRSWRPKYPSSLTETIEGETAAQRYRLEAAEARLAELGEPEVRGELLHECLLENGRLIGWKFRNSNGNIRTLESETFLDIGARLLVGATPVRYNLNYEYPQFLRRDGTVIGIRYSPKSDVTIEVLGAGDSLRFEKVKFHFLGGPHEQR